MAWKQDIRIPSRWIFLILLTWFFKSSWKFTSKGGNTLYARKVHISPDGLYAKWRHVSLDFGYNVYED